jgi:hypothetical protein
VKHELCIFPPNSQHIYHRPQKLMIFFSMWLACMTWLSRQEDMHDSIRWHGFYLLVNYKELIYEYISDFMVMHFGWDDYQ